MCDLNESEIDQINSKDKEALKDSNELIFVIESYGNMEAKDILIKAIEAMNDNLDEVQKMLK